MEKIRCTNFTSSEKDLLLNIVQHYTHIIENTKTDAVSVQEKNKTWELVAQDYNRENETGNRSSKQLRELYGFLKRKARKNLYNDRVMPGFPSSASDIADFLLFFDKVFDSINGSTIKPQNGKLLRCAVTSSSDHMEFWNEAVRVLSTIKFLKEVTNADSLKMITSVPPSIKKLDQYIGRF
ncbi:myb/sant-like dna-binding domain [Holotrichia oblita]|uniref:Myb/sant-like dna-binding domain n=1 Tax=Holotrichia oblita TaxID=644536 RepID=A0ACB9TMX1_HOLOL|nr:myb/sant-like dna-binding domain [Holotrichia oblita]